MIEENINAETLAQIHQLYGAQSHFIDDGQASKWAETFTADGEFHSPSYPAPVVGKGDLTRFATEFASQDGVWRHVITNVYVEPADRGLTVRAYLQIVRTPPGGPSELVRQTTITDELVRRADTWLIRRRVVRRDDTNSETSGSTNADVNDRTERS